MVTTGLLHRRSASLGVLAPIPVAGALILAVALTAPWIGVPPAIVAMGLLVGGLVAYNVLASHREVAGEIGLSQCGAVRPRTCPARG